VPESWQTPTFSALVLAATASYERFFGCPLIELEGPTVAGPARIAAELYGAPFALLCHDGGTDPKFTYANDTAQRLWERSWDEFIGLPSRLSAEPDSRELRAHMLVEVAERGGVSGYEGLRISATGRRFAISDTQVWNIISANGQRIGQAARIGRWQYLKPLDEAR